MFELLCRIGLAPNGRTMLLYGLQPATSRQNPRLKKTRLEHSPGNSCRLAASRLNASGWWCRSYCHRGAVETAQRSPLLKNSIAQRVISYTTTIFYVLTIIMISNTDVPEREIAKTVRTRSLQACVPCHRSKRKCNRRKPCSECLKRQRTSECAYEALGSQTISTLNDSQISAESETQILRERIVELEGALSSLRKQQKDDGSRGHKRSRTSEGYVCDEDVYYGRSFYLGGSSAPNLLQRMISLAPSNSSDLLFAFFGGTDGETITSDCDVFGQNFPAHYGVPEMLSLIHAMEKEQLEQRLNSYFEIVDPLHHYLPTPWILQRYERCITADWIPPPQELALIFAILALGDLVALNKSSWQLISASLHLLWGSKFLTSPSVDAVATFSYIAVYLQHEGRLSEYWPLLGMVIRIAQSMGLHRDPRWIGNLSREESEVRRRIFHTIAAQETALSIMFGRPAGLGYFDTDIPEDISDEYLFGGDQTLPLSYPHEISYNRHIFQLMEIARTLIRDCGTDTRRTDLIKATTGRKRILDWLEALPTSLRYHEDAIHSQGLVGTDGRARFVQSLVIDMIVNHSVLVLFRKPLLETSSPEAAEPCFRAAIAVSESWKVLQDSFPRMASITFMHWFRAFHASLICLIAVRAPNIESHIRTRAVNAWHSCKRIFLRLRQQNESMRCCSRALERLDQVLKADATTTRRISISSNQKLATDSSSHLRIAPGFHLNAESVSDVNCARAADFLPLSPMPDLEVMDALHASTGEVQDFGFVHQHTSGEQDTMDYGQLFQSFIANPTSDNTYELRLDGQPNGVAQTGIFDMDANNWPTWLINDQSPETSFNI